jgi:hypothetical protein
MFMTELLLEYSAVPGMACRPLEDQEATEGVCYIIVGASHAGRLASALKDTSAEVADLLVPGWRVTDTAIESSTALLRETLEEKWEGLKVRQQ